MHRITLLLAIVGLLLPFSVTAGEREKRIEKKIVVTHGEGDEARLAEIMQRVEAEIGDHDYIAPDMFCGHGKPHKRMDRLSEGAAECVLKNIRNASSDKAAMAVVKACRTLNPIEKEE